MGAIDRMIEEQHLLMHPFYHRWQKGKVSLDALRSYAVQYYAYEAQFPAVAATKADALRRFYGITSPEALEFFDLHSTLDHEHAAGIRTGLTDSEQARESAALALDAWWMMLDSFEAMHDTGSLPGPRTSEPAH